MSDEVVVGGLSQVERVVDTFIAPSRTFTDILRSTSWWLPFLLLVVVTFGATTVVEKQVGWERVAENQIHQNPKQEEKMAGLTDAQKANQMRLTASIYRYTSYGSFAFILVFVGLFALIYWASFNFGLGARTTYGQMFAVCMYASLPRLLTALLSIVTLMFGGGADSYNMQNPVGTNLAYFMPDASPVVKAAAVIVGWWVIGMIVSVGIAVATS
jgi:hypothetical protein